MPHPTKSTTIGF